MLSAYLPLEMSDINDEENRRKLIRDSTTNAMSRQEITWTDMAIFSKVGG